MALHITADTLPDLLAGAVVGLADLIRGDTTGSDDEEREIYIEEDDIETLLVSLLNAVLTEYDVDGFLPERAEIALYFNTSLTARLHGKTGMEADLCVKAATFHDLSVTLSEDGYETVVVFDV